MQNLQFFALSDIHVARLHGQQRGDSSFDFGLIILKLEVAANKST